MTDELNRRSPRILVRKNTPSETRENWAYIKQAGAKWFRLFLALLCFAMLAPLALAIYSHGYLDGSVAARNEINLKENHNVR